MSSSVSRALRERAGERAERLIGALTAHVDALASTGARTVELAEDLDGAQCAVHVAVQGDPTNVDDALRPLASVTGVTALSVGSGTRSGAGFVLAGTPYVTDAISAFASGSARTASLRRHAAAFFQSNRYLVRELVAVVADLTACDDVVDLYAGVGLFAVSIAAMRGGPVTAVERDPCSAADLVSNAAPLGPAVHVIRASVETFLKRTAGLEGATAIVDPPRAGLSREVVARLARRRPARIVYVSCDVATRARDLRALGESGYRLDQIQVFDMFPDTAHIETVVSLERT